ncbi:Uma2 family endonuclease, partial [Gemmata sp. JC717]|uniref:Uma2 family endonuclease n=1 Tax=Gemmata algarum TaxID=2975278 RepID=UPI0021BB6353
YEFVRSICPAGHYVRNQQSFDVGTSHDPGPNIALVPGTFRDYETLPPTVAILIVEIASSSLLLDGTKKAELYATAGVPEYWIVDLEHRQLIVFRDPHSLPAGLGAIAYRTHRTFDPTDSVAPLFAPGGAVLVSDLLPR